MKLSDRIGKYISWGFYPVKDEHNELKLIQKRAVELERLLLKSTIRISEQALFMRKLIKKNKKLNDERYIKIIENMENLISNNIDALEIEKEDLLKCANVKK